uniref:Uncharacterized protein n=1 Tax=Noccaea caerulescens TaxID=107243 RepID=A0A1J3G3U6_NOCCA
MGYKKQHSTMSNRRFRVSGYTNQPCVYSTEKQKIVIHATFYKDMLITVNEYQDEQCHCPSLKDKHEAFVKTTDTYFTRTTLDYQKKVDFAFKKTSSVH